MQKVFKNMAALGLAFAMCFGLVAVAHGRAEEVVYTEAAADYYAKITAEGGDVLLGQLHDLITTTHKTYTSYDSIKAHALKTDPGLDGRGVLEFYTHETMTSFSGTLGTWNREHVWCQSLSNGLWGTSAGGSDLHHIRPTEGSLNSTRGNNKYGIVTNGKEAWSRTSSGANSRLGGYVGGGTFEPLDNVKGDVARIVMYVYTHYNTYSNVFGTTNGSGGKFGTLNFTNVMSASSEKTAIELLLEWNAADPVDEIETLRNEEVYKIQGNRNPFIDNENYANAIWGDGTTTDPSVELKSLSITPSSLELFVGQTQALAVSVTPSNAVKSVTWSSSNESVATMSASTVTAKGEGTATITATSTVNPSIKATATVTVTKGTASTPENTVVIDIGKFSASRAYDYQTWSSGELSGTAYIYGAEASMMQFNSSKTAHYLASSVPSTLPIIEVTMKLNSRTNGSKDWKLLTSTTPYIEQYSPKPTEGNDQGTKTVTTSGVTWQVTGNDLCFALTYEGSGACYVDSITITFGSASVVDPPHEHSYVYEVLDEDCHTVTCSTCDEVSEKLPHRYASELDTECMDCGYERELGGEEHTTHTWTAWTPNGDGLTHSRQTTCDGHDVITETKDHGYTDDLDATCNECGYERAIGGEEQPDDGAKAEAFHSAVAAIDGNATLAKRYAAIKKAATAYGALTEKQLEDAQVKADVQTLQAAIAAYNEDVRAYNEEAGRTNDAALHATGAFHAWIDAFLQAFGVRGE